VVGSMTAWAEAGSDGSAAPPGPARGPVRVYAVPERGRDAYDAFVAAHPAGSLLQSWAWGELRTRQHWRPVRLLAVDAVGRICGAASVLCRRLPIGGSILYLPRGPVLDFTDDRVLDAMVLALRRLGERCRAVLCKIDPYVVAPNPPVERALARRGWVVGHRRGRFEGLQPRHNVIVPLEGGAEAVLARCHAKTRYNIRLAGRRGVTVRRGRREDLPTFHRLLMETCARNGFGERALGYFEQAWDALAPGGHLELYLASCEGLDLAAGILLVFGDKAVYGWGASAGRRREVMAPYALQWAMIQRAVERGCRTYDMTGVPARLREGEPGYGLWRFKRGFWPHVTTLLGEMDLPLQPALYRLWRVLEPTYWGGQVWARRAGRALGLWRAPAADAEQGPPEGAA
jgi:peptidoglycan pentaglycine glycine transferase (the first glycine)